jgi:copper chaperone
MSTPSDHPQSPSTEQLAFTVAGMTCDHCTVAATQEVTEVAGVTAVDVDLDTKLVQVHGSGIGAAAVLAAIDEAGYDAVTA